MPAVGLAGVIIGGALSAVVSIGCGSSPSSVRELEGGGVDLPLPLLDNGENVVPYPCWTWWVLVVGRQCQRQGGGE